MDPNARVEMRRESRLGCERMNLLFFYPFGSCVPIASRADAAACNQLDYFQDKGFKIHCILARLPGHEVDAVELRRRFPAELLLLGLTGLSCQRSQGSLPRGAVSAAWLR